MSGRHKGLKLSDLDGNRQNNFTIIRLLFAWLVLFGHSFAIQNTHGLKNPLNAIFQGSAWIGDIAVNGFFAISGFLVTASLLRRGVKDYLISRALRVFPALFLCVFLSVFLLGALVTTFSLSDYLSNLETYVYLRNSLGILPMAWDLPGVFEENRRQAVNGSLWTLTVEVWCYLLLAFLGIWGLFKEKIAANISVAATFIFGFFLFKHVPLEGIREMWPRPSLYFLVGVLFYINRDRVWLSGKLAIFALLVAVSSFGTAWYAYVFPISFAYLVFYLAYATKFINLDGVLGDISYGVYIYAWPVQQLVAQYYPELNPYSHTLLATTIVFGLAYCSWRFVEEPMLRRKTTLMNLDLNLFRRPGFRRA